MRRILSLVGVLSALWLVQCGGSTDGDGTTGGSAGSGGSAASGGSSGSGGTSGSGGSAGDPSWFSCNVNSDCVLRSASCCGSCSAATRQDSVALNQKFLAAYGNAVCGDDGCAACFKPPDPTLTVTCDAGTCQVVDLLNHPSTACQSASDCRVRTTDCCECGGAMDPDHLIAVSNSGGADYAMLVCDPNIGCPECEPVYPKVPVDCIAGHCQLVTGND